MNIPAEEPDEHDPLVALHLQIQQQARQLEMVAGAVDEMETVLRDFPAATATAAAGPAPTENQAAEPAPFDFPTLYTWVHIHIATITERKVSKSSGSESGVGVRWCTRWYEHDEAIARLEALRRAWEEHVVQPGSSMSSWYIYHYDPHIGALTSPGGPFWQCSPGHHQPARPIGHELLEGYPTTDVEDATIPGVGRHLVGDAEPVPGGDDRTGGDSSAPLRPTAQLPGDIHRGGPAARGHPVRGRAGTGSQ